MRKLFQLLANPRLKRKKTSSSRATSAVIKADAKTEQYIPMTFDFTAYFDDNELENNTGDISRENPVVDTSRAVFCKNDEKCNKMSYSSNIQQFECCSN